MQWIAVFILIALAILFIYKKWNEPRLGMTLAEVEGKLGHPLDLYPLAVLNPTDISDDQLANQVANYSSNEYSIECETHERSTSFGFNNHNVLIEIRTIDVRKISDK